MRHLFTLVLGGLLGVGLLAGDASACHKKKCGGGCAPVACVQPAPVVCPRPVKTCAPKVKKCGGLFHHKKSCNTCTPVVACNTVSYNSYTYAAPMPSGQTYAAPQATGQSYTPPVPSKR